MSEATARRQASSDAASLLVPSPVTTTRRPSPGAKLFGKVRVHRHSAPATANFLQSVTDLTKGPPCNLGRVEAWLFRTLCQRILPTWCSNKYVSTSAMASCGVRPNRNFPCADDDDHSIFPSLPLSLSLSPLSLSPRPPSPISPSLSLSPSTMTRGAKQEMGRGRGRGRTGRAEHREGREHARCCLAGHPGRGEGDGGAGGRGGDGAMDGEGRAWG